MYKIVEVYVSTSTGREVKAWNVVDTRDGYCYDTFSLKRDAKAWIQRAEEANKQAN